MFTLPVRASINLWHLFQKRCQSLKCVNFLWHLKFWCHNSCFFWKKKTQKKFENHFGWETFPGRQTDIFAAVCYMCYEHNGLLVVLLACSSLMSCCFLLFHKEGSGIGVLGWGRWGVEIGNHTPGSALLVPHLMSTWITHNVRIRVDVGPVSTRWSPVYCATSLAELSAAAAAVTFIITKHVQGSGLHGWRNERETCSLGYNNVGWSPSIYQPQKCPARDRHKTVFVSHLDPTRPIYVRLSIWYPLATLSWKLAANLININ